MGRLTGFTGELFDNMLIGSGAVILDPPSEDFEDLVKAVKGDTAFGERLGGTSGGINFSTDVETIDLGEDVDGLPAQLRGAIQFDSEAVSLETNLIELIPGRLKTLNPRLDATIINSDEVAATTTRGAADAAVTITAREAGTAGNNIRFAILVSGNNTSPLVTVDESGATIDITFRAMTSGAGASLSLAHQVAEMINNHARAASLVEATYGGDGDGAVAASTIAALTGGADGTTQAGVRYDPRGFFKDEDYHDRVALMIESRNKIMRVAVILYNCLVVSGFSLETQENMSPLQVPLNLTAMADETRKESETGSYNSPYRVYDYSVGR